MPPAGKGSFATLHLASRQSARAKTCWCCCSHGDRLAPTEVSITMLLTAKANRSYLSASVKLGRQLQANICKCKSRSYSHSVCLPNYSSSTLAAWGQALSLTPTLLLPARSVAQNGIEIKRPHLLLCGVTRLHGYPHDEVVVNNIILSIGYECCGFGKCERVCTHYAIPNGNVSHLYALPSFYTPQVPS